MVAGFGILDILYEILGIDNYNLRLNQDRIGLLGHEHIRGSRR